jgi:hypothetical protein
LGKASQILAALSGLYVVPAFLGLAALSGLFKVPEVGALSSLFVVPALLGLPVGVTALLLAQRDLAMMRKGLMDPAGEEETRRARGDAVEGALVSLGLLAIFSLLLLFAATFS